MSPDKHSYKRLSSGQPSLEREDADIQTIETKNGFSVLYKKRYLYSRFDAKKNSERLVQSLEIKDESLFFIFSPLLGHGLDLLFEKISGDSFVLAIETDPLLYTFSLQNINKKLLEKKNFLYLCLEEKMTGVKELLEKIDHLVQSEEGYAFRRLVPLELSSTFIQKEFQNTCTQYIDLYINQFWRNRITLVKLGRLYAKNIFQNLALLSQAETIKSATIEKPILVLGAGPSLEENIATIQTFQKHFFIIAVDTALAYLHKQKIGIDLCLVMEPQLINQKAFLAVKNTKIPLLADLCSYPATQKILNGPLSFFFSEYASLQFLQNLEKNSGIQKYRALGSVGLVAVETALKLRKKNTAIFFTGLDFSYQLGKTHTKETPSHLARLFEATRLKPAENIGLVENKIGDGLYTNPALENYARLFDDLYAEENELYMLSEISIIRKIKKISVRDFKTWIENKTGQTDSSQRDSIEKNEKIESSFFETDTVEKTKRKDAIIDFLENEIKKLSVLSSLLESIKPEQTSSQLDENLQKEIRKKLLGLEYLYIHFPEAYKKPDISSSFISRLKAE
ncbi:MAG TPA: 6-hydroxymethylpterin diphosphokinase MptE-like protein, partial [Treponemataceae bacterium]|nr:6-hydroxymethylpterin diphosphokinase MptE-like protein [Treponemataceae bacterium]